MPAIHPVKRLDGYVFKTNRLAAGANFVNGAAIVRNAAGDFAECGANPPLIAGFSCASVANYNWKQDTFGTVVPSVPVAMSNQEFRGTMIGGVWAAADLGASYGLLRNAGTLRWEVNKADAVNTRVMIVGVEDGTQVGDAAPSVRFVVLPANRQVIS
jgi:hypothetical protein